MAYSDTEDLLTGDLLISATVDPAKFVEDAAEEIDSKLGFLYVLPLPADMPLYQQKLLKQINNKLASGRLIMGVAIAGEDNSLHAYGNRLVAEAMNELMLIANGKVDLDAPLATPFGEKSKVPAGFNHDEESAVDMFEAHVMRGQSAYWNPGEVVSRGYPGSTPRGQ